MRANVARAACRALSFGLALGLAAAPRLARSAPAIDVLLVNGGSAELGRKLRAEVRDAGLSPIGKRAPGSHAAATLRILAPGRVELRVEKPGDAAPFEQVLEQGPAEGDSFALRVVEQLRARLVDVGWTLPSALTGDAASEPDIETSTGVDAEVEVDAEVQVGSAAREPAGAGDAVRAPASATEPPLPDGGRRGEAGLTDAGSAASGGSETLRVWLEAGAAASWALGGLGALPHAALGARLELGDAWSARASSLWPLLDAGLEAPEGDARVAWTGLSLALERSLALPEPWLGDVGLGGGLLLLDARGEARADFEARSERLYAGTYFAELSAGRELASWLRLRATAVAGLTGPRPVLRFDEREVASLGRFFSSLALGLELSWPSTTEGDGP